MSEVDSIQPSILITGANGFVGSRLCKQFQENGFRVIAGVRQKADLSSLQNITVEFRYGDITDPTSLPSMVSDVDYIIHNAGLTKAKNKQRFFDVNATGCQNLMDAIEKNNRSVKKVILISSLAAAGRSINGKPVEESDKPEPMTTYGRSKLAGEQIALGYKDKFPVLAIRPPGIYGPGDREIFSFFETVYKRIKPYIGDISRKLQLVYVDDLCEGIFRAITKPTESGSIYFICENRAYSMKELIALLEQSSGRKAYPLYIPGWLFKIIGAVSGLAFKIVGATPMLTLEKARELLSSWEVSTVRAERDLGFSSQTSFKVGAQKTYQWYFEEGWLK